MAKVGFCLAKGRTRMESYKYLEDVSGGDHLCNCALTEAREAHQQALEATHILEEKIEQLSQLATRIDQLATGTPIAVAIQGGSPGDSQEAH